MNRVGKLRQGVRHLVLAVRLVWDSAPGWTSAGVVVAVVQGLMPAASLTLTKLFVDAVSELLAQPSGAGNPGRVLALLPAVVGLMALGGACRALASVSGEAQAGAVSDHVQEVLQSKALEVDYQCYENPAFHDTLRMAQGEAVTRPNRIAHHLVQGLRDLLSLFSVAGVLALSHAYLLPIVLVGVIPGTVARALNSRRLHAWRVRHAADERYAAYLNLLCTSPAFAKELRAFGHGPAIRERFGRIRQRLRAGRIGLARERAVRQIAADALSFVMAGGGGLALVFLRFRTGHSVFTMGDIALLFRAFQRARGALAGWLSSLTALYEDSIFLSHFHDFLSLPKTIRSPARPKPLPRAMRAGLRVENVVFRYPGTDRDVLRDVSVTIRPGEHVAVVGENGAGKTTLAKLICRLYDPDHGRISVDGVDIRDVRIEEFRAWMSVLFQDYARYYMSAGENIRVGDMTIANHDKRIRQAAQQAGADSVISELPQGYETLLGRMFEGGVELSAGQWQRLALARTLVRETPFLLLDEHTSALDPKAEAEILSRLFASVRGRTVVVISHRLSTVAMVDRVIVLHRGRVVEDGPHRDLIRRGARYAALFRNQDAASTARSSPTS